MRIIPNHRMLRIEHNPAIWYNAGEEANERKDEHYPTGVYRSFLERLAFPVYSYHYENGQPLVCRNKVIETANIFTMNCPEAMMKDWNYPTFLQANTDTLATVFGASETLYACNTYQFADYSRYDITLFSEEEKRAHRDAQFPIDLANAHALGKRLVERAANAQ